MNEITLLGIVILLICAANIILVAKLKRIRNISEHTKKKLDNYIKENNVTFENVYNEVTECSGKYRGLRNIIGKHDSQIKKLNGEVFSKGNRPRKTYVCQSAETAVKTIPSSQVEEKK